MRLARLPPLYSSVKVHAMTGRKPHWRFCALVRGARDAQGSYLKDPKIAASIAQQTDLKIDAVENSTPYAIDPNLDIAKFEKGLREQEAVHRENGRLNYTGELEFKNVIDSSLIHEAAASVK